MSDDRTVGTGEKEISLKALTHSLFAILISPKSQMIISRFHYCQQRCLPLLLKPTPFGGKGAPAVRGLILWTVCRRLSFRASQRRNEAGLQQPQEYWLESPELFASAPLTAGRLFLSALKGVWSWFPCLEIEVGTQLSRFRKKLELQINSLGCVSFILVSDFYLGLVCW